VFGSRAEVAEYPLSERVEILWLEDGDHDLRPRVRVSGFTAADHLATLAAAVTAWAGRIAG
jgi:predicted alpha/beta-hydrolase family hydrolase